MKYKVLIVDDDPITVKMLEKFCDSKGFDSDYASSANECFEKVKSVLPNLILLDLNLPDQTGVELVPKIKSLNSDIPIVMISGSRETVDIVASMKAGASDYVQKPIDMDALYVKLKKLLEMSTVESTKRDLLGHDKKKLVMGSSFQMKRIAREISRIANSDSPVLILGESGTGKSLIAELIHNYSERKDKPFITINCAAIPANLLESELFGHVRGAFTGAVADKPGKFEAANRGTIFLDEIGELSLDLQVKLLRVLQGQEFERVGSVKTIKVDVRVIAATNRNLEEGLQNRTFRKDLYYRLNVLPLVMPSLRERKEDIPSLINHFFAHYCEREGKKFDKISEIIFNHLIDYEWPGNVRELQNIIERAIILGKEPTLRMSDFTIGQKSTKTLSKISESVTSIKDLEYNALMKALENSGGNITKAAKSLGISRDTVYRRLKKYKINLK